jgi:hypothetical protein
MSRRHFLAPVLAAFLIPCTATVAPAQDPASPQEADINQPAPAHIATVEGNATLERDGRPESGLLNMPLESGDRLRTTDGRIEVLFGDGSALYVDAQSTVDVQSDELLRLLDGRVRVTILGPARTISYRIDSPVGAVNITQPGDYRVALLHGERETQLELAVLRGTADIFTPQGSTPVGAGQRAYASEGLAPSFAYAFNSAMLDEFDQWIENQHGAQRGISAQYLAPEVQSYAPVLDAEGDWRYNQPYGYVWYPRVATGWRPYYYGRWLSYPRYGWTWVGNDRFGWPTHHYGRWGFSSGAWFWIPGSHWAPAYVSWAYAPGYVSWCPLGFDNRAVFALNVSIGRPYYSSHYSPWNYWTVVAAPHFGYGYVHQRVVHVDRVFAAQSRPVFVSRPSAPASRGVAVPRGAAPITWAGARGVPSRAGAGTRSTVGPAGRDSNYFLRDSNRADHAVQRESVGSLPIPPSQRDSGAGRSAAPRSGTGQGTSTSAPRAVPRSGGSVPMYQSRPSVGAPGTSTNPGTSNTIRVIPPGGVQDRATPRPGYSTVPRGGRDSGRPYSIPQAPAVTTVPRRAESPSPAPVVREAVPRARPQVQYAPHDYARPGTMAVPRQPTPAPRAYEAPRVERREAPPPPQRSVSPPPPPPRPVSPSPQRSASPPPRAIPREAPSASSSSSRGSSSPRGGGRPQ